jgi:hypothetical protein
MDRRVIRILGRTAAALALTAVLAFAAVAIALETLVDADELAGRLVPRASAALNRSVSIGEASLVLLPRPGARISDVRVDNLEAFEGPPVLEADDVWMELALFPLILGRVRVSGLRVEGPRIHLAIDERGVSNFGDLIPRRREFGETSDDALRIALRRIRLAGATVTYADAPESRALTLTGASLEADLDRGGPGGWRMGVEAASDSMRVLFSDPGRPELHAEGPSARGTLYGDEVFDRVEIEEAVLTHAGQALSVSGRISGTRGADPSLELRLTHDNLPAATMATWMGRAPTSPVTRITGMVALDARLLAPGPSTSSPVLRGEVAMLGVDVVRDGEPVAEALTGTLEFAPDTLLLHSVSGFFADGAFELYGRVAGEDRRVRIEAWARPDLAVLDRLGWTPEWAGFAGSLTVDVVLSGSLDVPERLDLTGTGTVAGLRVDHDRLAVPVYVPSGTVSFQGTDMSWSDVTVMAGPDPLQTTGRLNRIPLPVTTLVGALATPWSAPSRASSRGFERPPVLEAALHGGSLDLDAILGRARPRTDATYAHAAFAHLGRRTVGGLGAGVAVRDRGLSRPTALPILGSVALDLDTLSLAPWSLGNLSAVVELSTSELVVRDAAFETWGGTAEGALTLGVGTGGTESFALELALRGVEGGPFFATLTPATDTFEGVADFEIDLQGATERTLLPAREGLEGSGTLTLRNGSVSRTGINYTVADFLSAEGWESLPFERWTTDFAIRDTFLDIGASVLTGTRLDARLMGTIALEGGMDLSLGLSIPASELGGLSLRRTGIGSEVLDGLRADGRSLDLGLRLSGPLAGPTVEPDASVATSGARPR